MSARADLVERRSQIDRPKVSAPVPVARRPRESPRALGAQLLVEGAALLIGGQRGEVRRTRVKELLKDGLARGALEHKFTKEAIAQLQPYLWGEGGAVVSTNSPKRPSLSCSRTGTNEQPSPAPPRSTSGPLVRPSVQLHMTATQQSASAPERSASSRGGQHAARAAVDGARAPDHPLGC